MVSLPDQDLITWNHYHEFVDKQFMHDFDHQNVLEIGPFTGFQTQIIAKHHVKSLTLIEPNFSAVLQLKKQYPTATVICDDAYTTLSKSLPHDVVVCLGVLYHLHSPLFLLELIANQVDPKIIVLDSVNSHSPLEHKLSVEEVNQPGNRYSFQKSIPVKIDFPFEVFDSALNSLGYQLTNHQQLATFSNIDRKRDFWMARWEKC